MASNERELKQLREIKRELSAIKDRTGNPRRVFMNGILYGAGAFLGSIIAIALIGWLLSLLGIIPGLDALVNYVRSLVAQFPQQW